jgi:hypothetical protein
VENKLNSDIIYHICLTSAKSDTGMLKIVEILGKWRKEMSGR